MVEKVLSYPPAAVVALDLRADRREVPSEVYSLESILFRNADLVDELLKLPGSCKGWRYLNHEDTPRSIGFPAFLRHPLVDVGYQPIVDGVISRVVFSI